MKEAMKQERIMFDDIYRTLQGDKKFNALKIDAIDSGDLERMIGMDIDMYYTRHPMDLWALRNYYRGRVEECESFIRFMDVCIAKQFGVSVISQASRELKLAVDNTKPRVNGAHGQSENQSKEIN
jgi:hypothetical protein